MALFLLPNVVLAPFPASLYAFSYGSTLNWREYLERVNKFYESCENEPIQDEPLMRWIAECPGFVVYRPTDAHYFITPYLLYSAIPVNRRNFAWERIAQIVVLDSVQCSILVLHTTYCIKTEVCFD